MKHTTAYPCLEAKWLIAAAVAASVLWGAPLESQPVPCAGAALLAESVFDRATRVPLAGALVTASWRAGGSDRQSRALTDSAGHAFVCAPPGLALSIRASYLEVASNHTAATLTLARATSHTTYLDVPGFMLRGSILDDATGQPIANASVRIANTALTAVSQPDGRFEFAQLPTGDYRVRIEHISYATSTHALPVRSADLDATIRMAPDAIPLAAIRVTAFSRRLERAGFYDRQKRGIGTFIGRRQIDEMNVQYASDLLRAVPGVRLLSQSARRSAARNQTVGRGSCRYRFIIDGTRVLADYEMDNLDAHAIEGVEVYAGSAEVPAEFRPQMTADPAAATCGVIAVWMRDSR